VAGAQKYSVRTFHGMATFYRQFIKGFSTIMAPIMNFVKREEFQWLIAAAHAFKEIKQSKVPVIRLLDFSKVFEVICDTSGIGISRVLNQEKAFFSENCEELN